MQTIHALIEEVTQLKDRFRPFVQAALIAVIDGEAVRLQFTRGFNSKNGDQQWQSQNENGQIMVPHRMEESVVDYRKKFVGQPFRNLGPMTVVHNMVPVWIFPKIMEVEEKARHLQILEERARRFTQVCNSQFRCGCGHINFMNKAGLGRLQHGKSAFITCSKCSGMFSLNNSSGSLKATVCSVSFRDELDELKQEVQLFIARTDNEYERSARERVAA